MKTILQDDLQKITNKGKFLYSSLVIHPLFKLKIIVQIYQKIILLVDTKQYIPLISQIRFSIKQNNVQFDYQDNILILQLVQNDIYEWKQNIKHIINQKGFHEQFRPIKKIGKGNFASVYLVQKIQTKKLYAVKAFSKEAAYSQENGKECLQKQLQIMKQLNHKNTMRLYQVFQSQNSLYFIFELIQGGSLYQKFKSKYKFKHFEVQYIMKCLLQGLQEIHSRNIMHRDLKPENILIRKKDSLQCVIADFGLAQFSDAQTYLFTRCGTPGFVAPQVINIKDMKVKYHPICDIFSLGLIFYMLLFGKSLFKSKNYTDLVKQNRECKFNFDQAEFNNLEQETKDLLMKMLRTDPDERINAQQASNHPYFKLNLDKQNINIYITPLSAKQNFNQQNDTTDSSLTNKKQRQFIKKDSCIAFKTGQENIMNGLMNTVQNFGNSRVSFMENFSKNKKTSKFTNHQKKQKQQTNNQQNQ